MSTIKKTKRTNILPQYLTKFRSYEIKKKNPVRVRITRYYEIVQVFGYDDDVITWERFGITGPLLGESISFKCIPLTKGQ